MSHLGRLAVCALLGAASLLGVSEAAAQSLRRYQGGDWRRVNRQKPDNAFFTLNRFTAEARFGAYYPQIDEEFGGAATPYAEVFNTNPQFYFGLEVDWLPLRIPYVGVIGPGVGWGYTWASAKAKISGTDRESAQETSLWIMPMHASAVLRVDALRRELGIPIVPYGKLGFGWGLWSASTGDETATVDETVGRGTTLGTHMALGGMLSLGWLDPGSSGSLNDTTGIQNLYLFGEWMNASLDGLGSRPQMHVGSSSWVIGLAGDI
jgi:hypothetical protein